MGKRNVRRIHRFRPYERSTSIHFAQGEEMNLEDGEILEDNLDDTIKVVFDSRWTKHTGPSSSTASKPNFTTSAPKPAPCQPASEVQVTAKHSGVVGASTRINKIKGSSKNSKKLAACTQTQSSMSKDHNVEPRKKILSTPVMRMKHISVSSQAHESVVRPGLAMQSPMGFGLCKKTPAGSGSVRAANASLIASPALFALSKGGVDSFVASTPAVKRSRRDSVEVELQVVNKIPLVTLEEGELEPSVEEGEVTEEQTTVVAAGSGADSTAEVTEIRRVRMLDTLEMERRCAGLQSSCFEDVTPAVKKTAPVTAADLRADVLCLDTSGDRTLTPRQQRKARVTRPPLGSGDAAMLAKQPQRQRRKVAVLQTSGAQRHRATAVRQACRTLTTPHGIRILERRHIRRPERAGHKVPHRARTRTRKGELWWSPQRNPPPPSDIQFGADFRQSFVSMLEQPAKRPVIIDGPNIGYAHGKNKYCSCWGIKIALDFFKSRGHRCVVFIPSSFMKPTYPAADKQLLDEMYQQGDLAFTPSRVIGGRTVTCYDDRYVVMYATRVGGVMLSRDHYRDVALEREDWRHTIENRLLIPVFVGNQLMLPPDPMGRNGPSLEEYLTFPPGEQTALLSAVPPSPVAPSGPPLPRPSEILPDPDNLPPPRVHGPAKAAEPSQKPAKPSQKTAEPPHKPAEPSQKSAKPSQKSSDPSQKPAEPTSKPAPTSAQSGTKPAPVPEHLVPSEIPLPGENAGPPECRVT